MLLLLSQVVLMRPALAQEQAPAEQEEASSEQEDGPDEAAREMLQLGRLHFERGEFGRAVETFAGILGTPVKLRNRRDLHEAFLYYSFTLFLQGEAEVGREKLRFALRLDPEFAPSPVMTRPDLLSFYRQEQELFLEEHGSTAEPPETIFPELAETPGTGVVIRKRTFFPMFGIGLRQLGHPRLGNSLLVTEVSSASLNIASLIVRASFIGDRTPAGMQTTVVSRGLNYVSFGLFWGAILTDFVISMALRRHYVRHPERRRTSAGISLAPRNRKPQLRTDRGSLTLSFW